MLACLPSVLDLQVTPGYLNDSSKAYMLRENQIYFFDFKSWLDQDNPSSFPQCSPVWIINCERFPYFQSKIGFHLTLALNCVIFWNIFFVFYDIGKQTFKLSVKVGSECHITPKEVCFTNIFKSYRMRLTTPLPPLHRISIWMALVTNTLVISNLIRVFIYIPPLFWHWMWIWIF